MGLRWPVAGGRKHGKKIFIVGRKCKKIFQRKFAEKHCENKCSATPSIALYISLTINNDHSLIVLLCSIVFFLVKSFQHARPHQRYQPQNCYYSTGNRKHWEPLHKQYQELDKRYQKGKNQNAFQLLTVRKTSLL